MTLDNALGMQAAFTLPLSLPVVLAIAAVRPRWFYPAFMILLGAHYLPFVFMYGMWQCTRRHRVNADGSACVEALTSRAARIIGSGESLLGECICDTGVGYAAGKLQ